MDRGFGLIRNWTTSYAAAHDGAWLKNVFDQMDTATDVLADTAYRSAKNEAMLARRGLASRIHGKKPKGKPMPERTRIANAVIKSARRCQACVRAPKRADGLCVRTFGIARVKVKIDLAKLAYDMRRFIWLRAKYTTE